MSSREMNDLFTGACRVNLWSRRYPLLQLVILFTFRSFKVFLADKGVYNMCIHSPRPIYTSGLTVHVEFSDTRQGLGNS